jgi:hypothetical protein
MWYFSNINFKIKFYIFIACAIFATATLLLFSTSHSISDDGGAKNRQLGVKVVETWVEEWDPERRCWIKVDRPDAGCSSAVDRSLHDDAVAPSAKFGPFIVLNERVAAIVGSTNSQSLEQFQSMMAAFPKIDQLHFIDASGTTDDITNLKIGRLIRASGISTHVPREGSARSGAVELFIAGTERTMDQGARFAVHCWSDSRRRGPLDFPSDAPCNRIYINYYIEMGMSPVKAQQFYEMTNSVPHSNALWFGAEQMQFWLGDTSSIEPKAERRQHSAQVEDTN